MALQTIFVSHISEEAPLALILKRNVGKHFLGIIDVFVSSDAASVAVGDNWLKSIEAALDRATILVVLCSHVSIKRPWVNFEAGAAWTKRIPIIPLCHSGLVPGDLPMPLAVLQGVTAAEPDTIGKLYTRIASSAGINTPEIDTTSVVREIVKFENEYKNTIPELVRSEAERARTAMQRMKRVLEEPQYRYRSIKLLAKRAAIAESEAEDLLRADPDIVFSTSEAGEIIARLSSR